MPRTAPKASLKEYQAKRNFKKSPEPTGKGKPKPRPANVKPGHHFFCIQKHLASHLHYDFRLEHHGVLLSWAVPKGPSLNPKDKRLAMRVEDHPLDYGDFEGVIPEGYGAGIVMLWDRGQWTPETDDIDAALDKGELKFFLTGVKLKGSWVLVRTRGGPAGTDGQSRSWLLIKHRDDWAGNIDVTKLDKSVKSFGGFEDILVADDPDIWHSHHPAKGGEAGAMLRKIIEKAAKIKAARPARKRAQQMKC
jgi:bifunctional non-homologous end joining protein LigD